jgi:hypothetical protein
MRHHRRWRRMMMKGMMNGRVLVPHSRNRVLMMIRITSWSMGNRLGVIREGVVGSISKSWYRMGRRSRRGGRVRILGRGACFQFMQRGEPGQGQWPVHRRKRGASGAGVLCLGCAIGLIVRIGIMANERRSHNRRWRTIHVQYTQTPHTENTNLKKITKE